jgi:pyruvate-formate lyase-activating enzyme
LGDVEVVVDLVDDGVLERVVHRIEEHRHVELLPAVQNFNNNDDDADDMSAFIVSMTEETHL